MLKFFDSYAFVTLCVKIFTRIKWSCSVFKFFAAYRYSIRLNALFSRLIKSNLLPISTYPFVCCYLLLWNASLFGIKEQSVIKLRNQGCVIMFTDARTLRWFQRVFCNSSCPIFGDHPLVMFCSEDPLVDNDNKGSSSTFGNAFWYVALRVPSLAEFRVMRLYFISQ